MELTSFTAAHTVLSFKIVAKPVLVTQQYFEHCWKVFPQHHSVPSASKLRVGKTLGGYLARSEDPNWPKRYSTASLPLIKAQSKKKEAGTFLVMALVFPSRCYTCCDPGCQELLGHLSANGRQRINSSFRFICMHSLFFPYYKCHCIDTRVFLLSLYLLPVSEGSAESEQLCGYFTVGQGQNLKAGYWPTLKVYM